MKTVQLNSVSSQLYSGQGVLTSRCFAYCAHSPGAFHKITRVLSSISLVWHIAGIISNACKYEKRRSALR